MKKLLFLLLLSVLLLTVFLRKPFSKHEETQQLTDETVIEPVQNDDEVPEDGEQLYVMLDFDRRLILEVGEQEKEMCSVYSLAYARAILDNNYNADPYDYWDGDGAVWRWADFEDLALDHPLSKVLQIAYDEISRGRPVIIYTSGTYAYTAVSEPVERSSYMHFVLLLGCRIDADYDHLKPSDFYGADAAAGYKLNKEGYVPWVILSDEGPEKVHGEYSLYGPSDPDIHVGTCIAHADTAGWDSDLSEAIYPDYVKEKEDKR